MKRPDIFTVRYWANGIAGALLVGGVVLALSGCTTGGKVDPEKTVFSIATAYLGVQTGIATYMQLPRCTAPKTVTICHEQSAESPLQKANRSAEDAIDAARDVVVNHKNIDAGFAIAAARNAVNAAVKILQTYGVTAALIEPGV